MKQKLLYLLASFLLVACNRSSSKKAFILKKDDFTFYTSKSDVFHEKLSKYPNTVYSFGTCNESVLYKGLYVDEYTTDCNDSENFLEETFLIFLDSCRVFYYSKGRKSRALSVLNNYTASERTKVEVIGIRGERRQPTGAIPEEPERLSIFSKKKRFSSSEANIELDAKIADYQRRGYYEIRRCSTSGLNDNITSLNNESGNRLPIAGSLVGSSKYKDSGYCLDVELERPINFRKAEKAKRKIAKSKSNSNNPDNTSIIPDNILPNTKIIKSKERDEFIAKYSDKVYMGFRILEEISTGKLVLKLEYLTKPYNRSRILGAAESRTIFVSQAFREQVVFSPREKKNLVVFIKDGILYEDKSQLSRLSW